MMTQLHEDLERRGSGKTFSRAGVEPISDDLQRMPGATGQSRAQRRPKLLARKIVSQSVTVNIVALDFIESRMVEQSNKQEKIEALLPMKQTATHQEAAHSVGLLASEKTDDISGRVIGLHRGMA